MAPFQYDTPSAPLTGSIADVMMRGGDIRARMAIETARINAAAAAQRGAIWGNTISNLSQIPTQLAEQKRADAVAQQQAQYRNMQMLQMGQQVQEHQQAQAAQNLFEQTMREQYPKFQTKDESGKPTTDYEGLTGALREAGVHSSLIDDWMTKRYAADKAQAERQDFLGKQRDKISGELSRIGHVSLTRENFEANLRDAVANQRVPPLVAQAAYQKLNEQGDNYDAVREDFKSLNPAVAKHFQDLEESRAKTTKELAEAQAALNKPAPTLTPAQQALESYKASLGLKPGAILSDAQQQAYDEREKTIQLNQAFTEWRRKQEWERAHPNVDQVKLEKDYSGKLQTAIKARNAGIGREDGKVLDANHLMTIFEQAYDPKTGDIKPNVLQMKELAMGLAKMISAGNPVGEKMMSEFDVQTSKGDYSKVWQYITGRPQPGTTPEMVQMLKESIERQADTAAENRNAELGVFQGYAPSDLDPVRRDRINAVELVPRRRVELLKSPTTGKTIMRVSKDGGRTWQTQ